MAIKVVLCGDGAVGKTAIRQRYMGFEFRASYLMTIGADFALKSFTLESGPYSGRSIKYQIWDLAGQQRFSQVRSMFYKGSFGALLVYDVTRLDSFENIKTGWIAELEKNLPNPVPVVLIANKIDLRDQVEVAIDTDQGKELASNISSNYLKGKFEIPYIETSAKTGQNISTPFNKLAELIIKVDEES